MALQDTTSITGGYGQSLTDWQTGDDRVFTGTVTGLPSTDPNLSDAYFTLKLNPNDIDANAIVQKHITTTISSSGVVSGAVLSINVFSSDIEGFVLPGTVYNWDFRVITSINGKAWTVATGTVAFAQQVTQTNKAGTPAALPNNGLPRIRGFAGQNPSGLTATGNSNVGDLFFNSTSSSTTGWRCTQQGTPGTWVAF